MYSTTGARGGASVSPDSTTKQKLSQRLHQQTFTLVDLCVGNLEPKWPRSVVVVVVEWLYYSKRIIIDKGTDLSDFFSLIFVGKMCVFVSRPMKIVLFLLKKR